MKKLFVTLLLTILLLGSTANTAHTTLPEEEAIVPPVTAQESPAKQTVTTVTEEPPAEQPPADPTQEELQKTAPAAEAPPQMPIAQTDAAQVTSEGSEQLRKVNEAKMVMIAEIPGTESQTTTAFSTEAEEIPSVTVHAKTGCTEQELREDEAATAVLQTPPEPGPDTTPPPESADMQTAIEAATAYAASTYGVTIDSNMDYGNSSYFFPGVASTESSQETLNAKAIDIVSYTIEKVLNQCGVSPDDPRVSGMRINVDVQTDGNDVYCYCFYG